MRGLRRAFHPGGMPDSDMPMPDDDMFDSLPDSLFGNGLDGLFHKSSGGRKVMPHRTYPLVGGGLN